MLPGRTLLALRCAGRLNAAAPVPRTTAAALGRRHNQQAAADSGRYDPLDVTRRRLIYRSKQRGWLEIDIMLGNWASARLKDMGEVELKQFDEIIEMENPDLYKWLTGQTQVPPEVNNPLLRTLCAEVKSEYEPKATVKSVNEFAGKVWE